jgi:hypothetical protein
MHSRGDEAGSRAGADATGVAEHDAKAVKKPV